MPVYNSEDYNQIIIQIKKKIADLHIEMERVLSENEIVDFEKRNHVHLPQAYRIFLKEVGNGCSMIDGFGLNPLDAIETTNLYQSFVLEDAWIWEDDDSMTHAELTEIMKTKLNGQMELINIGCGMSYNLIVTGKCRGEVWMFSDVGVTPCCERQDFLGWFDLWLDMQDNVDYFKDYVYE